MHAGINDLDRFRLLDWVRVDEEFALESARAAFPDLARVVET